MSSISVADVDVREAASPDERTAALRLRYGVTWLEQRDGRYADHARGFVVDRNDDVASSRILLASVGGELVGTMRVVFRRDTTFFGEDSYPFERMGTWLGVDVGMVLTHLALADRGVVLPAFRRRGVFRALFAAAAGIARREQMVALMGVVLIGNEVSCRALRSFGYTDLGVTSSAITGHTGHNLLLALADDARVDGTPRMRRLFAAARSLPRLDTVPAVAVEDGAAGARTLAAVTGGRVPTVLSGLLPEGGVPDVLARLVRALGTEVVDVRAAGHAVPGAYSRGRTYQRMSIASFVEAIDGRAGSPPDQAGAADGPAYLANVKVAGVLDALGVAVPPSWQGAGFEPPSLWVGPAGATTPLHRDSTDNLAFHLLGRKRWTLFPVADIPYLYETRILADPASDLATSAIDLRAPDLESFPLFAHARAVEVVVHPGQTLFLPAGWSHFVVSLDRTVMVNVWPTVPALSALS